MKNSKNKLHHKQNGFTIVELMIAISVLSVILLMVSVGIIQISKNYYKNIIYASTQQTARAIMEDVSQSVEFGSFTGLGAGSIDKSGTYGSGYVVKSLCIGPVRYSYVIPYQQSATAPTSTATGVSQHVLWKDTNATSCTPLDTGSSTPDPSPGATGSELLGDKMRLTKFSITQAPGDNLYTISVTIMYGDNDLIDETNANPAKWVCKSTANLFSAAFCAKSELTTVVGKRLR